MLLGKSFFWGSTGLMEVELAGHIYTLVSLFLPDFLLSPSPFLFPFSISRPFPISPVLAFTSAFSFP